MSGVATGMCQRGGSGGETEHAINAISRKLPNRTVLLFARCVRLNVESACTTPHKERSQHGTATPSTCS